MPQAQLARLRLLKVTSMPLIALVGLASVGKPPTSRSAVRVAAAVRAGHVEHRRRLSLPDLGRTNLPSNCPTSPGRAIPVSSFDFPGFSESPFDDLIRRFFGDDQPALGRSGRPAPSVQRIEIGELLDSDARELVSRAARAAAEWGSSDLDTEHLM